MGDSILVCLHLEHYKDEPVLSGAHQDYDHAREVLRGAISKGKASDRSTRVKSSMTCCSHKGDF